MAGAVLTTFLFSTESSIEATLNYHAIRTYPLDYFFVNLALELCYKL